MSEFQADYKAAERAASAVSVSAQQLRGMAVQKLAESPSWLGHGISSSDINHTIVNEFRFCRRTGCSMFGMIPLGRQPEACDQGAM